eukprot:3168407-Amphidinium_carterae.1
MSTPLVYDVEPSKISGARYLHRRRSTTIVHALSTRCLDAQPSCSDVVSEHGVLGIVLVLNKTPCLQQQANKVVGRDIMLRLTRHQAKIANFHVAIRIQQDVGRFDVSVQHLCRVHVLQRLQQL